MQQLPGAAGRAVQVRQQDGHLRGLHSERAGLRQIYRCGVFLLVLNTHACTITYTHTITTVQQLQPADAVAGPDAVARPDALWPDDNAVQLADAEAGQLHLRQSDVPVQGCGLGRRPAGHVRGIVLQLDAAGASWRVARL